MMCNYIKFCADHLLIALGCPRLALDTTKFGNLFEWMEMISLQGKHFFLKNVLENVLNLEWEWTEKTKLCP